MTASRATVDAATHTTACVRRRTDLRWAFQLRSPMERIMQATRAYPSRVPICQTLSPDRTVRHGLVCRCSTLSGARSARSRLIHPTKRRCLGSVCRKISISLSNWWSEAVPIGWPRPASNAFSVTYSSSPAISTETQSSIRIRRAPASFCRLPRWSAPRAVTPVPACSRN